MAIYVDRRPFWLDIYKELWKEYFPFEQDKDDYLPCSFTPIFTEQLASAYYSNLWSEMLASDMITVFTEKGFENKEYISFIGKKLKETVLSVGGGSPFQEVFRSFVNRDPSIEPLWKFYNNEGL